MTRRQPSEPRERSETLRQAMIRHLQESPATAKDLSGLLHIPEKEVADHLEHLRRSLKGAGARLYVVAAECLGCGFIFEDRRRLTKPSACPRCRGQRIDPPAFSIPSANPGV